MSTEQQGRAAYAPPSAISSVIDRARNGTQPATIDADWLLRIGVQESLGPRTVAALKTLGLIDGDGAPTDMLRGFGTVATDLYPETLQEWLKSVYSDVFQIVPDPSTATLEQVSDAFRGYSPSGQRTRMVTLFIGLCDLAGLLPEDSALRASVRSGRRDGAKAKAARLRKPTGAAAAGSGSSGADNIRDRGERRISKGDMLEALSAQQSGLDPVITGLVRRLPPADSEWPQAKREAWLKAASAMFDVLYTLPDDEQAS